MKNIYEPIIEKINSWVSYEQNKPKVSYEDNPGLHDEYRSKNDLDCILNDGNLNADTIISLWLPLRIVLVRINGYEKLNYAENINNKIAFLKMLQKYCFLEQLLPREDERVILLSELFERGQNKENTMILPRRDMQVKGKKCYDYMPYFLYECFPNGMFSNAFGNDKNELNKWVREQKLTMFFKDEIIEKENIIDLSGSGNVTLNVPPSNMEEYMLRNYIDILKQRKNKMN